MSVGSKGEKLRRYTWPTLAVAGGFGALGYLRNRWQRQKLFGPDRHLEDERDPAAFGLEVEDRFFAAEPGVELHGWWIPHRRALGTVLYCHGSSGSIVHRIELLATLRRLRVNLFAFDYRGYGRSTGEPSEAGLFRDARAAWDHLVDEGVPAAEILLFGHSLGGAVAIDCALDRPAAGLVVESSFTQVRDLARASYPRLPLHLVARNQFRSVHKVGRLTLPKLFIHGGADERVPPALGRRLYEAAAEPKELYLVPGAGHNDVHGQGGVRYLRRIARFRTRCLRIAASPESSAV